MIQTSSQCKYVWVEAQQKNALPKSEKGPTLTALNQKLFTRLYFFSNLQHSLLKKLLHNKVCCLQRVKNAMAIKRRLT